MILLLYHGSLLNLFIIPHYKEIHWNDCSTFNIPKIKKSDIIKQK